ncbi:uncharacterized protein LOC133892754 [Phragmites australis]|uniref:uncharacterized protein LOC133892754 n=1 Tax=Phragmites australis TaxID=29695 RepID=UPI002D7A0A8E|nr:uncharacterized protein LOC133892754 [Phragmites australis]
MDAAGPAARFSALEAELAAKTSRIADLEARVSLLYAENARLRKALAKGEGTDRAGEEDPKFGRLAAGLGGNKHEAVEKQDGSVACDVIEVSDCEEGMAIGVNEGRGPEEGVVAVPTPRKRAVRVVTGESEDVEDADGGNGNDKGSARCNSDAGLEDDDVLITARCKKRAAARVVTTDSEDEDEDGGELGSDEDDEHDKEGGVTPSRKRALRGFSDSENEDGNEGVHVVRLEPASLVVATHIESGEEDEDDSVPICQALKKMRKKRVRDGNDDELGEAEGCSTPATRRLACLVKNQSKGGRAARQVLDFVEPKEYEGSEDDMEEDNDMDEFINDDDSLENATDSAEESCAEPEVSDASARNEESSPEPEESDSEINYADVMACIGRKRNSKDWEHEGQMLSAFDKHPELCLKAVCALYRKQTEDERSEKATLIHNKEGFSQIDARRGSRIAEFLLDGDPYGPLKKTVSDLEEYDRYALEFCHNVAARYSKQLFAIYQNKEDTYFRP